MEMFMLHARCFDGNLNGKWWKWKHITLTSNKNTKSVQSASAKTENIKG